MKELLNHILCYLFGHKYDIIRNPFQGKTIYICKRKGCGKKVIVRRLIKSLEKPAS